MKVETCIDSLICYAMNTGLAKLSDHTMLVNGLLELLYGSAYHRDLQKNCPKIKAFLYLLWHD